MNPLTSGMRSGGAGKDELEGGHAAFEGGSTAHPAMGGASDGPREGSALGAEPSGACQNNGAPQRGAEMGARDGRGSDACGFVPEAGAGAGSGASEKERDREEEVGYTEQKGEGGFAAGRVPGPAPVNCLSYVHGVLHSWPCQVNEAPFPTKRSVADLVGVLK